MATPTRTSRTLRASHILSALKILCWIVIAIALVKIAFFPSNDSLTGDTALQPGGSFDQITTTVTRADITNTVSVTGTIQSDDPFPARSPLDGEVTRLYASDGDTLASGDPILQLRKEVPGEERRVTDEEGNTTTEIGPVTYRYETVSAPGDGTLRMSALVGQRFSVGDQVAQVSPPTFSIVAALTPDQMYRLQDAPSQATITIKNGPAPFQCTDLSLLSPHNKSSDNKSDNTPSAPSTDLKARCSIPSDQTVFAGLQATLDITAGTANSVLAVPISAVEGRYQSGSVYLPTDDPTNPTKQSVTLGMTDGKIIEIKEGLAEGDTILEFTPAAAKENTGPYGAGDGEPVR